MYVLYCVVGSNSLANHYPLAPWPVAIKTHFGWLMTASNATRVALYSVVARFCTSRARGGCPSLRPIRPIYGITMPIDHATPLQSTDPLPSTLLIKPEHPTAKALVKRLMLNAGSDWWFLYPFGQIDTVFITMDGMTIWCLCFRSSGKLCRRCKAKRLWRSGAKRKSPKMAWTHQSVSFFFHCIANVLIMPKSKYTKGKCMHFLDASCKVNYSVTFIYPPKSANVIQF